MLAHACCQRRGWAAAPGQGAGHGGVPKAAAARSEGTRLLPLASSPGSRAAAGRPEP